MTELECVLAVDLGTSGPKVALVGLGPGTFPSLAATVRVIGTFEPDTEHRATYRELAHEFRHFYRRTKSMHSHLNG